MGKRLSDEEERIVQKSVGFNFRQMRFFNKYPDFKPDVFCREAIDNQIRMIDQEFAPKESK